MIELLTVHPLVAGFYAFAGAILVNLILHFLPENAEKGWTVHDPGSSFFAVQAGDNWFMYKIAPGRDGHYILKRFEGPYWNFKESYLLDNPLDHPKLYGFDSLEEAIRATEELTESELIRDGVKDQIVTEAGRHVFFRRRSEQKQVEVHGEIEDLDALMEAQFGDEDLSGVKLGAEGKFSPNKLKS